MKKLLNHIRYCIKLYQLGYFFSGLTHNNDSWGFIRLNHSDKTYAILDIDFEDKKFCHAHSFNPEHRWDAK